MKDFQAPIENGYRFTGSKYVANAWSLLTKDIGSYIGASLMIWVISIVVGLVPIINFFGSFIQIALWAGVFVFAANQKKGTQTMNNFFSGFDHFGQLALFILVLIAGFAVPMIVFFVSADLFSDLSGLDAGFEDAFSQMSGVAVIGVWVLLLFFMYLGISYTLVMPLIVNGKMKFWQAMETSRRVVAKNFFYFLGFYILMYFAVIIGALVTLIIGFLLIGYPLILLIFFSMYDMIFPDKITDESVIEDFGSAEEDINTESQDNGDAS